MSSVSTKRRDEGVPGDHAVAFPGAAAVRDPSMMPGLNVAEIHRNASVFRPAKVRTARRRLDSGRYDGDGLLDAVLERILAGVAS
jgi:hypothetical protein